MQEIGDQIALSARLVDAALAAGAEHAEVYLRQGATSRITLQPDHTNESMGFQSEVALRVWCADRHALLTSDALSPANLAALARTAVELAHRQGMLAQPLLRDEQQHYLFADSVEEHVTPAEKVVALQGLLVALKADPSITQTIINACYADQMLWTIQVNSHGFSAAYRRRRHTLWVWIEGANGHATAAASSRCWADFNMGGLERHLGQQAALLQRPVSRAPSGQCEVLLSPLAAADLARSLGVLLTAENVLRDLKRLLGYIDQPIAAPALTLIDDSTLADGLKSRPIDDEGTPSCATRLIEHGKLRSLLHTLRTAAHLGVAPNGKAVRAALWDQPHAAASNIYVQAGQADPAELRRSIRRGLVVEGVMRPGRITPSTGKFTIVVQGWWIEQGEAVQRVSDVPLSASIFSLLRGVRQCGADLQFSPLADGAGAPSLLIEQMQVG